MRRECRRLRCGALILAHDTKGTRNELKDGGELGTGAVAGSSQWTDGSRGAFHLARYGESRIIQCIKANYARSHWGAEIGEITDENGYAGLTLVKRLDASEIAAARTRLRVEAAGRKATVRRGAGRTRT